MTHVQAEVGAFCLSTPVSMYIRTYVHISFGTFALTSMCRSNAAFVCHLSTEYIVSEVHNQLPQVNSLSAN